MSSDFDFLLRLARQRTRGSRNGWMAARTGSSLESFHQEKRLTTGGGNFVLHQYVLNQTPWTHCASLRYDSHLIGWKIDRFDDMTRFSCRPGPAPLEHKGSIYIVRKTGYQRCFDLGGGTKICKTFACWEQALRLITAKLGNELGDELWKVKWQVLMAKELKRCPLRGTDPPLLVTIMTMTGAYPHDDRHLFEMLIWGAQAGLSWITILRSGQLSQSFRYSGLKAVWYNARKIKRYR